ncbi:hypothetical protein HLV35_02725 [Eggerthellaceae bacterium zg-997]|nr:hypothetical protein [Eggerthellaceae bacterium zg-997]
MLSFMPGYIPDIVQAAPFALAFCLLCVRPLRAFPVAFYAPITVLVAAISIPAFCKTAMGPAAPAAIVQMGSALDTAQRAMPLFGDMVDLLTSAVTGVWLYLVVMFIGVMHKGPIVRRLFTVRSELSILGGIIVFGHVLRVIALPTYFMSEQFRAVWGTPALYLMFAATVVVGIALTVLFVVPWVTSFRFIRRRMKGSTWKKVQKTAYPFMYLMLLQGALLGMGHAALGYPFDTQQSLYRLMGNPADFVTNHAQYVGQAWVYLFLIGLYTALLVRRQLERRERRAARAGNAPMDGTALATNADSANPDADGSAACDSPKPQADPTSTASEGTDTSTQGEAQGRPAAEPVQADDPARVDDSEGSPAQPNPHNAESCTPTAAVRAVAQTMRLTGHGGTMAGDAALGTSQA